MNTNQIRYIALRYLKTRDYSNKEIKQKLTAKGYALDLIEPLLIELNELGLINDARFTENYIRIKRNKGYGPLYIRSGLRAKGIDAEVIAEQMEIADNAWFANAHQVWQKRFKGLKPKHLKERAQQARFLQNRGFTQEQIEKIISDDRE